MVIEHATTIKSLNPATKEVLGEAPCFSKQQVEDTVKAAWEAYQLWRATEYKVRANKLLKLRRVIERHSDELARLITQEVGKPLVESYMSELIGAMDACVWFAENTEKALQDQSVAMSNPLLLSKQSTVSFEPIGVVGIISPWNYPFAIPVMSIVMAVMVGDTVVLKPSEKCPLVGIRIGELFVEAGFPQGVVSVVTGERETGSYLTGSNLAKLIFTGSPEVGAKVMAQAAANLTPVSLELGGKDAAIVLPDAPVDWTARGLVWGAFTNCGQACASIERLYLVKGANTEKLIEKMVSLANELEVGNGLDDDVDMGPLIDQGQLDKVAAQVEDARGKGAKVLCGGTVRSDLSGYFYAPTIITGVTQDMAVMNEETFGPVLPIAIVESEDEAIQLANDSKYGLSASIWTNKLDVAEDIACELEVGTVFINDGLFSFACPQVPWGGMKKSGTGRSHSYFGLLDLVNIKHTTIDSAGGFHRLWWYPYGKNRIKVAKGGLEFLHGTLFGKLGGVVNFVTNYLQKPKSH
jgi:succinate-semialdehyde dehydrogenase/glutarate-semialdehyde dehydrogenase